MTLLSFFPSNFPHVFVFPDLLSTGKLPRPPYPILSSLSSCGNAAHSYLPKGSWLPQPHLFPLALPPLFLSSSSSHLPPVVVQSLQHSLLHPLPAKKAESTPRCLQLIASRRGLSWALRLKYCPALYPCSSSRAATRHIFLEFLLFSSTYRMN